MNVSVDTNVLVRALVLDDPDQAKRAVDLLANAKVIAVSLPCFCELVWVLTRVYKFSVLDIASAIRALIESPNVKANRPAVHAGLAVLEAGGGFADGVIAFEGQWLGGNTFVSFDKAAVTILSAQGTSATLL